MSCPSSGSTASETQLCPLVAGLDLLTTRERDADSLAHTLAALLVSTGAHDLFVATHWAKVDDLRHVALSVESAGIEAPMFQRVLDDLVRDQASERVATLLDGRHTGASELRGPVEQAVEAHTGRTSGRAVVFPGSQSLIGTLTVAQVHAASAIDRIRVLVSGDADPNALVQTRDFVRPRWTAGELILHVQPAANRTLVPFETPFPTPCCADHR